MSANRYAANLAAGFAVCIAASFVLPALAEEASGYRQVENWTQLPAGSPWGVMSSVAIDAKGRIYALRREKPTSKIMVFDGNGKYLTSFAEGMFKTAHGIFVAHDGTVWATDRDGEVVYKFSGDGKLLMTLGKKDVAGDNDSREAFHGVSGGVEAPNGDIYLTDGENVGGADTATPGNARVLQFSKDGKLIKFWGTRGKGDGQFNGPHCIAMNAKGQLLVCDRGNKRVEIFDQGGKYLGQMAQFGAPGAIAVGKNDTLYVTGGADDDTVYVASADGTIQDKIGGLTHPHGIAVDASGAIYVAEVGGGDSLLKFVKK